MISIVAVIKEKYKHKIKLTLETFAWTKCINAHILTFMNRYIMSISFATLSRKIRPSFYFYERIFLSSIVDRYERSETMNIS